MTVDHFYSLQHKNTVLKREMAPYRAGFALAVAIGANGEFYFQMALKNHNWRKYLAPRFLKIALH